MEKKQTGILLQEIDRLYPGKIALDAKTLDTWHRIMKNQNYECVIRKLDQHAINNKFMPTIYDLYERPRPEHDKSVTVKIDRWEEEASGSPQRRS